MRNILLNTWVVILLVLLMGGVSACYAFINNDYSWVSRSGSVITVLGLLLTIKHSIFSESRDIHSVVREKNHYAVFAPDRDSDVYKDQTTHAKKIIKDEYLGFFITIIGTIIWGYGDLVGQVIT
ncbi:MAG: hypothetical protein PF690_01410 [Deltaproteobacteria bacterium]|jgi:predicted ABC-type exoprotein transport system permease subunit|nr:hypothetical protein [Deltaproteobacteria bacterium]